jgi:hypothetical protein
MHRRIGIIILCVVVSNKVKDDGGRPFHEQSFAQHTTTCFRNIKQNTIIGNSEHYFFLRLNQKSSQANVSESVSQLVIHESSRVESSRVESSRVESSPTIPTYLP